MPYRNCHGPKARRSDQHWEFYRQAQELLLEASMPQRPDNYSRLLHGRVERGIVIFCSCASNVRTSFDDLLERGLVQRCRVGLPYCEVSILALVGQWSSRYER